MICPGECCMFSWEKGIFCCCWVGCSVHVNSSTSIVLPSPLFLNWPSVWLFYSLWKIGLLKSPTTILILSISPFSSACLPDISWSPNVLCIYVCNCYIFLVNWPFYPHFVSFFVFRSDFWLPACFVWYL